jgi:HEAT repeat protein
MTMGSSLKTVLIALVLGLVMVAPASSRDDDAVVGKLLSEALKARGDEYRACRSQVVSLGEAALPLLKRKAVDPDWHVAAIAAAIAGRIEQPDLYQTLEDGVKSAVGFAWAAEPEPRLTILHGALEPILPAYYSGSDKAEQARRRQKTLDLWGGPDGTAFMIEAMLKGCETPTGGKKHFAGWRDLGRDFCTARLGISTQPMALPALLEALQSPEFEDIANAAAYAFKGVEKQKAEGPLVALLNATKRPQQDYIVQALANIKSARAAGFLPALVDNTDSFQITRQLVEIGGTEAAQALVTMLTRPNEFVRCSAAEALTQMKAVEAVGPLIGLLEDRSERVRAHAAQSLGAFQDARATDAAINALRDSSWWVRSSAANGLGSSGDKRAVPALMHAVTDSKPEVRGSAITALAQMGDSVAADVILAGLNDPERYVRIEAARAQGTVKDPRAVEPLIEMLAYGDYEERLPARLALRDITGVSRNDAQQWREWWAVSNDKFRDKKPFESGWVK